MNIIRIVVDEISSQKNIKEIKSDVVITFQTKLENGGIACALATQKNCLVVVEDECVWKLAERDGGFGERWWSRYNPNCEASSFYIYDDYKDEWKFCPNCGKRIRYESEE